MTEKQKKVYSDEKIKKYMRYLNYQVADSSTATMLQQLMDERDAVLKDLKALEGEIEHVQEPGVDTAGWLDIVDTKRSEKYDTDKAD